MNRRSARAGVELLRERVRMYGEYAELLEEQERAADAGDLERVSELTLGLKALESALGHGFDVAPETGAGATDPGEPAGHAPEGAHLELVPDSGTPEATTLQDQARILLERAAATQRRVVAKLRAKRDEARGELRSLEGRDDQVRSYLRGSHPENGRLNVRF